MIISTLELFLLGFSLVVFLGMSGSLPNASGVSCKDQRIPLSSTELQGVGFGAPTQCATELA